MNKIIGGFGGLIGVLLVYGVINLVLVGGQNALHAGDQARLDEIKKQLEVEKTQISSLEANLSSLGQTLDSYEARISDLKSHIRAIEVSYPNGAPSAVYADYQRMLAEHNSMIAPYNSNLSQFKAMYADYSSRVDRYNTKVDEANALAKKIGSTWVVVPVPRLAGRK